MKSMILAIGAFGLLVAAPALAQAGGSTSKNPVKPPMSQPQSGGSMGAMSGKSGAMAHSSEAKESKAAEARETRMSMKHRKHHAKHRRTHHA
jgi:hypothetical protein